jgi:hypothetical protein
VETTRRAPRRAVELETGTEAGQLPGRQPLLLHQKFSERGLDAVLAQDLGGNDKGVCLREAETLQRERHLGRGCGEDGSHGVEH